MRTITRLGRWTVLSAVACAAQCARADLAVTNTDAVLTFNAKGSVVSLRERATGRELLARPGPMAAATLLDGRDIVSDGAEARADGRFVFMFSQDAGKAVFNICPFEGGWSFTVEELTLPEVKRLVFCDLTVTCRQWGGRFASLISDPKSGVALRAYDLSLRAGLDGNRILIAAGSKADAVGKRFGLAGAPRARLTRALQAMTVASGVPVSFAGGAWSRDAEECRGSYLQPILEYAATDDWIDLARRGSFSTIHFRYWMDTLGHYGAKTNLFPRGWTDLFAAADKIHAAGLRAGIHTLTACISPKDPWVASDLNTNLLAWATYTLAADLPPDAAELVVNEVPGPRHDTVFTYSGDGNAIRIGTEIVQYSGVRRTKPYAFTGLARGAFGTRPAAHTAGDKAAYLQQRYLAFYPDPDSPLADALADQIARFFHGGRFDQIYLDGAEGEGLVDRRKQDKMMRKIISRLRASPVIEASDWSTHNWWQHSRVGAWDSPYFDAKRFIDDHVRSVAWSRDAEFLGAQMGWWSIRNACPHFRGLFSDENEYFSSRVAGMDATMSVTGLDVNKKPLTFYRGNMLTVMGWYERFRLARAWADGVQEKMNAERAEFRLRQDAQGLWTLASVTTVIQRVKGTLPGSETWRADFSQTGFAPRTADVRVEAFYVPGDFSAKNPLVLFDPASEEGVTASSASNVVFRTARATDPARGAVLRLHAENKGTPRNGSWTCVERVFSPHASPGGSRAMGFWVQGDGSGAILNFQLNGAREYGGTVSDHFVKLDFTGWRYVDFVMREREAEEALRWKWEASRSSRRFRSILNMNHLYSVAFLLNSIPPGREVNIALSEARMFRDTRVTLDKPVLAVNGEKHPVPFALVSGDFAELEEGVWRHYREDGTLLAEAAAAPLSLSPGINEFRFAAGGGNGLRAEVTVFAKGAPFPALRTDLGAAQRQLLSCEPALDLFYAPSRGADGKTLLKMRPSERAALEIEILGPVEHPVLTLGAARVVFPASLKEGDRLFCRDGRNWRVTDAERRERAKGVLAVPVPSVSGVVEAALSSAAPASAAASLKLVKLYADN
ncbi:MAG: hypothetical protein PHV28_05440 [Kiritimatiellae bacterium]|nr:hypothetical protein [Kiritimatiellia bacterium]